MPIREIAFVYCSSLDFAGSCKALQGTFTQAATSSVTESVCALIYTRVPALLRTHHSSPMRRRNCRLEMHNPIARQLYWHMLELWAKAAIVFNVSHHPV